MSTLTVKLSRFQSQPWGFRLAGGKDFNAPLSVQRVQPQSLAEQAGLQPGDYILKINDGSTDALRHKEAQDAIVRAGNSFELTVQRGGTKTWKPAVIPTSQMDGGLPVKHSLAADKQEVRPVGSSHNVAAKPFSDAQVNGGDRVAALVHNPYNSPAGLYSMQNIAETLTVQAEILTSGVKGFNFMKDDPPINTESAVYKMVQEEDLVPPSEKGDEEYEVPIHTGMSNPNIQSRSFRELQRTLNDEEETQPISSFTGLDSVRLPPVIRPVEAPKTAPPAPIVDGAPKSGEQNLCSECGRLIVTGLSEHTHIYRNFSKCFPCTQAGNTVIKPLVAQALKDHDPETLQKKIRGVFVRIKDKSLHADCFRCNTCGSSLKNVGYYNINDKLYCDVHARQVARHNPPAGNLTPVTVPPGVPLPSGISIVPKPTFMQQPQKPTTPTPGTYAPIPFHTQKSQIHHVKSPTSSPLHDPFWSSVKKSSGKGDQKSQQQPSAAGHVSPPKSPVPPPIRQELPLAQTGPKLDLSAPAGFDLGPPPMTDEPLIPGIPSMTPEKMIQECLSQMSEPPRQEPAPSMPSPLPLSAEQPVPVQPTPVQPPEPTPVQPPEPTPVQPPEPAPVQPAPDQQPAPQPELPSLDIPLLPPSLIAAPAAEPTPSQPSEAPAQLPEALPYQPSPQVEQVPLPQPTLPTLPSFPAQPPLPSLPSLPAQPPLAPLPSFPPQPLPPQPYTLPSSSIKPLLPRPFTPVGGSSYWQPSTTVEVQRQSMSFSSKTTQQVMQYPTFAPLKDIVLEELMLHPIQPPQLPQPPAAAPPKAAAPPPKAAAPPPKALATKPVKAPSKKPEGAKPGHPKTGPSVGVHRQAPGTTESTFVSRKAGAKFVWPPPKQPDEEVVESAPVLAPAAPAPSYRAPAGTQHVQYTPNVFKQNLPSGGTPPLTSGPSPIPKAPSPTVPAPFSPAMAAPVYKPVTPPAPAPAPAPAPIAPSTPAWTPPSNIGAPAPGSAPPAPKGSPNVPGSRSAPKRGRGVLKPQVAPGTRIPICAACASPIRGPFVTALGKTWCPDHFVCTNSTCRRGLQDVGFVEEQGQLYCETCYETYLAPICSKCNSRIKGDCLNAIGKQWHPDCFICAYCHQAFGNSHFYLEDGLPYCEKDWNELFTTKCVACGFPIEAGDRWVEALNSNFHSQCFKCTICHKNLEGQSFFAKGGRPFCKSHAR